MNRKHAQQELVRRIVDILSDELHPYSNEDGDWIDSDDMEKAANRIIDELIRQRGTESDI